MHAAEQRLGETRLNIPALHSYSCGASHPLFKYKIFVGVLVRYIPHGVKSNKAANSLIIRVSALDDAKRNTKCHGNSTMGTADEFTETEICRKCSVGWLRQPNLDESEHIEFHKAMKCFLYRV